MLRLLATNMTVVICFAGQYAAMKVQVHQNVDGLRTMSFLSSKNNLDFRRLSWFQMLIDTQCVDNSKLTKLRPTTTDHTRIIFFY